MNRFLYTILVTVNTSRRIRLSRCTWQNQKARLLDAKATLLDSFGKIYRKIVGSS